MADTGEIMAEWTKAQKTGTKLTFAQFMESIAQGTAKHILTAAPYDPDAEDRQTSTAKDADAMPTTTGGSKAKSKSKRGKRLAPYLTGEEDPFDQTDEEFWGTSDTMSAGPGASEGSNGDTSRTESMGLFGLAGMESISEGRKAKGRMITTVINGDTPLSSTVDVDPSDAAGDTFIDTGSVSGAKQTVGDVLGARSSRDAHAGSMDAVEVKGVVPKAGGHEAVPVFDVESELESTARTSQMEALYHLLKGENVILSGQAGAGKSWVVETFRKIVDELVNPNLVAEDRPPLNVAYTASTGVAATLIRGTTIHSWSGLNVSVEPFSLSTVSEKQKWWLINNAFERIRQTDCLVIDEVSMLPAYLLENLDREFKIARKNDKPFGGMQVVLVGDFLQLPPVCKDDTDMNGNKVNGSYCFKARTAEGKSIFGTSGFKWCYLDQSKRSTDDALTRLLNDIRDGSISRDSRDALESRFEQQPVEGKAYTELRTTNRSVDAFNDRELDRLEGEPSIYRLVVEGDRDKAEERRKNGHIQEEIHLKPGAVVMLTSNQASSDPMLVNGSMGKVVKCWDGGVDVRFNDGRVLPIPMLTEKVVEKESAVVWDDELGGDRTMILERPVAKLTYLPVRLAWAVTVHKSQGQTLDGATIDLSRCFTEGLGYVALSRCRSLDDVIMRGSMRRLPGKALLVNEDARDADLRIRHKAEILHSEVVRNEEDSMRLLELLERFRGSGEDAERLEDAIMDSAPMAVALADDLSVYGFVRDHRSWGTPWDAEGADPELDALIEEWASSPRLSAADIDLILSLKTTTEDPDRSVPLEEDPAVQILMEQDRVYASPHQDGADSRYGEEAMDLGISDLATDGEDHTSGHEDPLAVYTDDPALSEAGVDQSNGGTDVDQSNSGGAGTHDHAGEIIRGVEAAVTMSCDGDGTVRLDLGTVRALLGVIGDLTVRVERLEEAVAVDGVDEEW